MSRVEFRQAPAGSVRYGAALSGIWNVVPQPLRPTGAETPVRSAAEVAADLAAADLAAARRWLRLALLFGFGAVAVPTLLILS